MTVPADLLNRAERDARERKVNLSTVITEGMPVHVATRSVDEVMAAYRWAFEGFSGEELKTLDGIVLEAP